MMYLIRQPKSGHMRSSFALSELTIHDKVIYNPGCWFTKSGSPTITRLGHSRWRARTMQRPWLLEPQLDDFKLSEHHLRGMLSCRYDQD